MVELRVEQSMLKAVIKLEFFPCNMKKWNSIIPEF